MTKRRCLRTWAILSRRSAIGLPQDIDALVQAVYSDGALPGDLPDAAAPMLVKARKKAQEERSRHAQLAEENAVRDGTDRPFTHAGAYRTFQDADEDDPKGESITALTRLGQLSVSAVAVHVDEKGNWRLSPEDAPFSPTQTPDDALARRIWGRQVRLSRYGVCRALMSCRPQAWHRHPLLRGLTVMELRDGRIELGNTMVTLSKELGLIYST